MTYKNAEDYLAYTKAYYERNKERISANQSSRVDCGCGKNYTKRHHAFHLKTPKHRAWLETVPPIETN